MRCKKLAPVSRTATTEAEDEKIAASKVEEERKIEEARVAKAAEFARIAAGSFDEAWVVLSWTIIIQFPT